jgi:hypothetical protein
LVFRRTLISVPFHQHSQLARRAGRLPLPVVVHIDQRQRRFLVQLADLGQPFLSSSFTIRMVVPLPCLGVLPLPVAVGRSGDEAPSPTKHLHKQRRTTVPSTRFAQPAVLWYDLDHGSRSGLESTWYGLNPAASRFPAKLHRRRPASARTLVALVPT